MWVDQVPRDRRSADVGHLPLLDVPEGERGPRRGMVDVPRSDVTFAGVDRTLYASSDSATRGFCGRCGTQISFTADYMPGLIDLTIGSMDHPEHVVPQLHCWHAERLPWAEFADGLPRHPEFPPHGNEQPATARDRP